MRKSFLAILFLIISVCHLNAQPENDTLVIASTEVVTGFVPDESIIHNVSGTPLIEGFLVEWNLNYDSYTALKENDYTLYIRYKVAKDKGDANWVEINRISLKETRYAVEHLSGGETYLFQLGVNNGVESFWLEEIKVEADKSWGFFNFLVLIGSLGLFIYGMKIMSDGLQRAAGSRLRYLLGSITSNRLKGVLAGFGITALIQSSSVTTVMTVSFVNAGLLTLTQSVGVLMGANIGTTLTGWIVNFFGFEVNLGPYALVLIAIATPMMFLSNPKSKAWANALIGFSLLFMGLGFLNAAVPQLETDSTFVQYILGFNSNSYWSILLFAFFGVIITVIVQSSSAALALTMTLVAGGIIPFEIAGAMVIGQNVGTTVTAELAATVGNVHAKRAARINTLFNTVGALVAIILFPFLIKGVILIMNSLDLGNPYENSKAYGNTGLAILHTVFNVANVGIFIWFVPNLVRAAEKMVKSKGGHDEEFHLDYIGAGYMSTPNLSLLEAKKEIAKFGEITSRMSKFSRELLFEKSKKVQKKLIERIAKYEEITDRVEVEIANYLNKISEGGASPENAARIRGMNRIVNELERIGDIFYQISKGLEKKADEKIWFSPHQRNRLAEMFNLVDEAFNIMIINLNMHSADVVLDDANKAEKKIVEKAEQIRTEYLNDLSNSDELNMKGIIIYNNICAALERVGGHIINVSEGVKGKV